MRGRFTQLPCPGLGGLVTETVHTIGNESPMRATQAPPGHTVLRRELAEASEHLRTLRLAGPGAELTREVACTALAALQVALLADADPATAGLVSPLVRDDVERIAHLIGARR